ncbi:MAG: thiamine diphosphokinase [Tannerellaceae bacterium]|nr:thiamine diphosphokinase [Tannerellaceae bacterium]
MLTPYDCVVMANGRFPTSPVVLGLLEKASVIVACDGAVEALHLRGFAPAAIVGDLDSIPPGMRLRYAGRLHADTDQETNDLTKAIRFVHAAGHEEALILGATGLREDHSLGNISLLLDYAPLFQRVEMLSDYGLFTPLLKTATLQSRPRQQVSIFSLNPEAEISTENLRWPIDRRKLTSWWQGTLNEALHDSFTVRLAEKARVVVYRAMM